VRRVTSILVLLAAVLLGSVHQAEAAEFCSQPVSESTDPSLRDCIHVARSSIGLEDCAKCLCDVDGSGDILLTDALVCLRHVVGNDVVLACPDCSASTTTSTTIPGCASCNDVLTGVRDYDDLCPLAKFIYDDMRDCPLESCRCACGCPPGYACAAVCLPGCCGGSYGTAECTQCLVGCLETVRNCREN
jgi:hypothetical protein